MNSKGILTILSVFFYCLHVSAQVEGNASYSNSNSYSDEKLIEQTPYADFEKDNSVLFKVNALFNAIADNYVAVFNVNQVGETASVTNSMMDSRLNSVKQEFINLGIKAEDIYIDMLTFVPEYEYDVQKKLFSKSYNEIPKGFRLQKNIHIRYSESKVLDKLIAVCAQYEIYDLVKVDYYSKNPNAYYDSLRISAKKLLKEKIKDYKELGLVTDNAIIQITENSFVKYPQEQYANYQAFNSSSLDAVKKSSTITQVNKTRSSYYNPVTYKGYEIVFNPILTEPVIQYALTMKVKMNFKSANELKNTEYYIVSPSGDLKLIKK